MSKTHGMELPKGWAQAELGAIVEPRTGKANPQATPLAKFIGMEQVEAHTMRLLGTVPASTMKSGANVFQPLDVLYGRMRAYLNKVYQPDFGGLCSGEFIVLPETGAVLGRFLKYRMNSGDFVRFANHLNTGDRPRVDFDQIKVFALQLPPKTEQERIADALDELLSDLDAGVAALERVRAKLKHFRAAVLKAAVEGALTADWRTKHPNAEPASTLLSRILAERRRRWEQSQLQKFKAAGKDPTKGWKDKYQEPAAPDTTGLPALPGGWCWASLDQLCSEVRNGYSSKPDAETGVPILRISSVRPLALSLDDMRYLSGCAEDYASHLINEADLLFTRYNGTPSLVGVCALVPKIDRDIVHPDKLIRCRMLDGLGSPNFVAIASNVGSSRGFLAKRIRTTAGQAGVSGSDIKETPIPFPPTSEQDEIAELVEDQLSVIDHLESDLETKLKSAQALRQSILRHAFTGQLVPQDPSDEPAGELLKRIIAEREHRTRQANATKSSKPPARCGRRKKNAT